jgi:hypothetical protein
MMVTHHEKYMDDQKNLGYQERLKHVELIRGGARCYMIMCVAKDVLAAPREMQSFNSKEVFVGGEVINLNGDTWVEVVGREPLAKICPQ